MREVERTGFVDATPAELDRHLSPRRVIEHEGPFSVVDTDRARRGDARLLDGLADAVVAADA